MEFFEDIIDKLEEEHKLSKEDFFTLLSADYLGLSEYLFEKSRHVAQRYYGNRIFLRGLIEFTNYCRNDCYYCGIRKSNSSIKRYHLSAEEILDCCKTGYELGFRTFVLQGGEDLSYSDEQMVRIISKIRQCYADCAITLSIGEKSRESYLAYFHAGADRYLLRHETANEKHYQKLHPKELSFDQRISCLWTLKEIGYQVGSGFMTGSPFQTPDNLAEDLLFLQEFQPDMIGIGPFLSHKDTPFCGKKNGTLEQTLFLIGILRLMFPNALIPATTALGTVHPRGRELGILAGANVVMPNLSPSSFRSCYALYDNKICTEEEAAEGIAGLKKKLNEIGYQAVTDRGDKAPPQVLSSKKIIFENQN